MIPYDPASTLDVSLSDSFGLPEQQYCQLSALSILSVWLRLQSPLLAKLCTIFLFDCQSVCLSV